MTDHVNVPAVLKGSGNAFLKDFPTATPVHDVVNVRLGEIVFARQLRHALGSRLECGADRANARWRYFFADGAPRLLASDAKHGTPFGDGILPVFVVRTLKQMVGIAATRIVAGMQSEADKVAAKLHGERNARHAKGAVAVRNQPVAVMRHGASPLPATRFRADRALQD